ncbi:MAG: hypothetical protein QF767_08745 [Alphaproteobacteria bacterium]|nr:hypothetical protein [Alphaproteobacteria bacterium]
MALIRRVLIVAGMLWLGAVMSGGAAAQESAVPDEILRQIAAAGAAAERAEAGASTPLFERRATAARLNAAVISALASHSRHAGVIMQTAMASASRHRDYVAEAVTAAFPGYRDLAWQLAAPGAHRGHGGRSRSSSGHP